MQKPLTVANWNHLEDALAGTSLWRLDPDEEFRAMFDGPTGPSVGAKAAGRIASNDDLLTARSAISASCLSNWPDRRKSRTISGSSRIKIEA
jgi:hypothetical protein